MPLLAQRDASGCAFVGALDEFVQRLDEGPSARSLHHLAGQLHMTGGELPALQVWVHAVRARFDAGEAACFDLELDATTAPRIVCDPVGASAFVPALEAMRSGLAQRPDGAGVVFSSSPPVESARAGVSGAAVRCGTRALGFAIVRAPDSSADELALLQYLAAIAWHLRCAAAAVPRVHADPRPRTGLMPHDLLSLLPLPCVLTDAAGRCIERNEAFDAFMGSVALQVITGRLRFSDPYVQDSWHAALGEVHATAVPQSLLATSADARHWRLHLVPLRCVLDEGDTTERELILAVAEQEVFGTDIVLDSMLPEPSRPLTPAENQVLNALLQGHSAKVIASARGASVNTVRSQIMTILEKTGHHNQKSLMAAFSPSAFRTSALSGFSSLTSSTPPSRASAPRKR